MHVRFLKGILLYSVNLSFVCYDREIRFLSSGKSDLHISFLETTFRICFIGVIKNKRKKRDKMLNTSVYTI